MTPRPATPADLPAITALHTGSWRRFYRDEVGDAALGPSLDAMMAAKWTPERLAQLRAWVIDAPAGGLAGFVACFPDRAGGPFVDNLHVAAEAQERGLGRALMAACAADLVAGGHGTCWLEVLDSNARARAAYRAMGGVEGPRATGDLLGRTVMVRYVHWLDLGPLARLAGARVSALDAPDPRP